MLADRFGRKKIIVMGTITRLFSNIPLYLCTSWEHMIIGLLMYNLGYAHSPAYSAIIAESLPERGRGAGFGAFRMATTLLNAFAALLAGIVMDSMGVLEGYRAMLLWSTFVVAIVLWIRSKYLVETLDLSDRSKRTKSIETKSTPTIFKLSRELYILTIVASVSNFATQMIQPFIVLYVVEVIELTKTEWGGIQTVLNLIAAFLAVPGGLLSDRIGRIPCILASRIMGPVSTIGLIFSRSFIHVLIIQSIGGLSVGLGGGGPLRLAGGPAWQALVADLTPSSIRGSVTGLMRTLNAVVGAPAAWIGGYVWDNHAPESLFWLSLCLGLIPTLLLFLVKEPPRKADKKIA
jgi:MFS family permease